MGWKAADSIGVALFNFDATGPHQLSLTVGDLLCVMEEYSGWLRGYLYYQPSKIGLFPANFVEIKESVSVEISKDRSIVPSGNEVAMEASVALKSWQPKLVEFYISGQKDKFRQLLHSMEEVITQRGNIIHSTATLDVLQSMRTKLTAKIDSINHQLSCPLTPRDSEGSKVNCNAISAQKLYQIHRDRRSELEANVTQTGSLQRKSLHSSTTLSPHLFVQVNHVDHTFPEPCEIFMFLYDKDGRGQLSERFYMSSDVKKKPREAERPCALFTDLSVSDVQSRSIFLVCQIIRRGKMLLDDKKNVSQSPFRRPYACGIVDVTSVLQSEGDSSTFQNEDLTTYSLPLYLCFANHESDFSTFHDKIVVKTGGKGGQKPGCSILLSLRLFRGELSQLQRDFSLILTKSMQVVHKMGFPEIILPGDVRNDIYITLETGQFEKGHKRAERNVEVAIEVLDGGGKTVPGSIVPGAGATPTGEYESFIFYHNNYPRWNETFKLSIPFEMLPDTHLRISFRHVAKNESRDKADKTFAFTFLKIMNDDGSIIKDGLHELYVYKADSSKKWYDPKVYLSHLSRKDDITRRGTKTAGGSHKLSVSDASYTGSSMVARSFKEYIQLSTLTISTKLTQKIELLMLLKWRQNPQDLGVALTNLMCVDGEEVIKFLQDTLDCLFDILNSNQEMFGLKVFDVLVFIFGLLLDERYQHFNTVLDIYISKHFSALLSHKFLLWAFNDCLQKFPSVADQHPKLVRVIQAMRYIFRFMAQSHVLYARQNKRDDAEFKEELKGLFSTMSTLMGIQENKIRNIHIVQSALLVNLPHILPEVIQVLPETELASLLATFLGSVRNSQANIPRDKMEFVMAVLDSPVSLLHTPASRKALLPTFVKLLVEHMDVAIPRTKFKSEEASNVSCMVCMGALLGKLSEPELGAGPVDLEFLVPLLYPVLRLCKQVPKPNPLHAMNSVNLIGLLDVMQDTQYSTFFSTQKEMFGNDLQVTLEDFMATLKEIICGKLFPETWVSMYLMQNRVISRALLNISTALRDNFLRAIHFTPSVWDQYFSLCTRFLVQPSLQLEQFSDYQQHQYRDQFGDMRLSVGRHVISMWHKLGEQKGNFIPDLIGPFLEMTLIKQVELRGATLPVIFDIMRCEHMANGNFKRVETEVFDKTDALVFQGHGDEEYRELFSERLTAECEASKDLAQSGSGFIDLVSRLIGMLLDYRSVATDDSSKGRQMGCMLNLLNFYKEIEKHELYVRYIYKLAELHQKGHNHTEAGFTLLLHAGELEWTSDPDAMVSAEGRYPEQTSLQRKEQLYMEAIQLFSEGKSWECGVPLCKELATLYETTLFDYPKLASILKKQAMFHERIIDLHELRVAPEYFMVGYYGRGFPLFLRNKVFIHRGQPYEKLTSFIKRLTDEFTTAQILKTVTPPDNEMQNSSGMYLQLRSVQAIPEDQPQFRGKQVPDRIVEYYKSNEVQRFTYDRPFHKGSKNKECEFASLWIERTTFTTDQKFPGVIGWFEVSSTETVELNPLDIALETVSAKNSEIQSMVDQYRANHALNINPLSMQLNGVIDATVMGGVANYEKIFFNAEYVKTHPDHQDGVKRLRELIEEQAKVLAQALQLHSQRIDPSLRGLHDKLEQCFEEFQCIVFPEKKTAMLAARNKPTVTVSRSKTLSRPLPPAPSLGGSPPIAPVLRQPKRRATGKPGKIARPPSESIYEETEFTPSVPVKRSVSSLSAVRSPAPSQPPPRLAGGSPMSTKKRLSASLSSGGSSEQLDTVQEKRASTVSTESLEDVGGTDYEPIQDYLVGGANNPPENNRVSTMSLDAPSYPAPPPPAVPLPTRDDDDGYTKVSVHSMGVESTFAPRTQSKEWAELPLKTKTRHTPNPSRSSELATPTNTRLSSSPQSSSPPKGSDSRGKILLPPEPNTPPPSPPTVPQDGPSPQPRSTSPLTQAKTSSEQPQLPPKQKRRQQQQQLGPAPQEGNAVYEFDRLNASPSNNQQGTEDNVYFDHLSGPPEKATPTEPPPADNVYFDHLAGPPPSAADQTMSNSSSSNQIADNVYFDHLATGSPPTKGDQPMDPSRVLGAKSPSRKPPPSIPKGQKPLPELPPGEDAVYFDHLTGPPPTSPTRKPPSISKDQKPLPELPPERVPAELPKKPSVSTGSPLKKRWPPSPEHDEVDPAPPPPVPLKKRNTSRKISEPAVDIPDEPARPVPRPRINTIKKSDTITEVTPPPRPPKQSPAAPSLPPRPKPPKPFNGDAEPQPPPLPTKPGGPNWRK